MLQKNKQPRECRGNGGSDLSCCGCAGTFLNGSQSAGTYPYGGFLMSHVITCKHTPTHTRILLLDKCIQQTMVPSRQIQLSFFRSSVKAGIHGLFVMHTSLKVPRWKLLFKIHFHLRTWAPKPHVNPVNLLAARNSMGVCIKWIPQF